MYLSELKKGQKAVVKNINANSALKQRLFSLGIIKGAIVEIIDCSITKSTIELKVGNTLVAIRDSEAKNIEVELLEEASIKGHRFRHRFGRNS